MALTGASRGRSSGGYGKSKGAGDKKLQAAKKYATSLALQRSRQNYRAAPIPRQPYKAEPIPKR